MDEHHSQRNAVMNASQCIEIERIWESWTRASRIIIASFHDEVDGVECNKDYEHKCVKDMIFERAAVCLRTLLNAHLVAMRAIVKELPGEGDEEEEEEEDE